jgi:hypothetical protein
MQLLLDEDPNEDQHVLVAITTSWFLEVEQLRVKLYARKDDIEDFHIYGTFYSGFTHLKLHCRCQKMVIPFHLS